MRQLGAVLLGIWYSIVLSSALTGAIEGLSDDRSAGFGNHYFLLMIAWLLGIGLAAYLSALASRRFPLAVSVSSTLPIPLIYLYIFLTVGSGPLDYRMSPLIFGWGPTALGFVIVLCLLTVLTGFVAGRAAADELAKSSVAEDLIAIFGEPESHEILGIHWVHWYWLWIPMAAWAYTASYAAYYAWLGIATGWHWAVHPSLWLDWHWWVFSSFGVMFVFLPVSLLQTGLAEAWVYLAGSKKERVTPWSAAIGFAGYGLGVAIIGTAICIEIGNWFLVHLPIVAAHGKPWWIL